MTVRATVEYPRDYSLTGKDTERAIEQGLEDARWYATPIPRDQMRRLLERRDGPAIRDTLIWFGLLFAFGIAGFALWGTWWAIIPFALYGVIYASSSDSRWHESSHGTAFKTDWMNNALYEIASFMVLREATPWRWSHTRHHSDTIIVGLDPEIAVPRPVNLPGTVLKFLNLAGYKAYFTGLLRHVTGNISPDEATYIPESAYARVFTSARIYLLIYLGVIALAVATRSILPLMFIGLPHLYGSWLMVTYGLTQHAGMAEDVLDHRLNTRTVYMNRINRYLYWNMGYHIEHHMFPMVPYHALPALHELVKHDMPAPFHGIAAAYREIIPTLVMQSKDPTYYVKRELPASSQPAVAPVAAVATSSAPVADGKEVATDGNVVVDGWVAVGASGLLKPEDVLRFDYGGATYAIYRTADHQVYATDGVCTHGQAQLADGLVMGTLIECPKHNGRFDVRDGSPQRLPVCIALKTYDVRERDGMIWLDVTSAHGPDVTDAAPTYSFRVVSNANVATFIKELVLEPDGPMPAYQPGDYLQFEIPVYPIRTLTDVTVNPPYADVWQAQGTYDLWAENPIACRRDYSMAGNPAADTQLRFNVRIATPPRGVMCSAGVGSAYLFSLQPGDRVTAIGPFGSFHIKETEREMVYLGGGSGMAPLRAHISNLFETQKTARRVSYWYGARALQELFYADYFEELARDNPNFTFHVALSEPQPDDAWTSHTGFIHDVLKREYLDSHPDPTQIEYYLCGPLPMVRAAMQMLTDLGIDPSQIASDEF